MYMYIYILVETQFSHPCVLNEVLIPLMVLRGSGADPCTSGSRSFSGGLGSAGVLGVPFEIWKVPTTGMGGYFHGNIMRVHWGNHGLGTNIPIVVIQLLQKWPPESRGLLQANRNHQQPLLKAWWLSMIGGSPMLVAFTTRKDQHVWILGWILTHTMPDMDPHVSWETTSEMFLLRVLDVSKANGFCWDLMT